jgi:hypothetical protein
MLLLLLPVSMIESPNTNTAGSVTFDGSSIAATIQATPNNMKHNIKVHIIEERTPIICSSMLLLFLASVPLSLLF